MSADGAVRAWGRQLGAAAAQLWAPLARRSRDPERQELEVQWAHSSALKVLQGGSSAGNTSISPLRKVALPEPDNVEYKPDNVEYQPDNVEYQLEQGAPRIRKGKGKRAGLVLSCNGWGTHSDTRMRADRALALHHAGHNATLPCDFARLPDDCVNHLVQLIDAEAQISPASLVRSGPSVTAWAWAQPAFRVAVRHGTALVCAQLGNLDLLERVLDHFSDIKWLMDRAARRSIGDATQLDLNKRSIRDAHMPHLVSALRVNATVTKLDLGSNRISALGAQHIAEALRVNATVTELTFFSNHIGAVGAQHIAEALK
ncbi:hypothetical protein T492DRAFT_861105, partial [Pavlovales sp. CCMP2436]